MLALQFNSYSHFITQNSLNNTSSSQHCTLQAIPSPSSVGLLIGHFHPLLLAKAKSRRALGHVKNDILALEEDVTKDGETNARVGLDTAKAGASIGNSKVDVGTRN